MESPVNRLAPARKIALGSLLVCLMLALDPFNLLVNNRASFVQWVLAEDLAALAALLGTKSALGLLSHTSVSVVVATIQVGELTSPLVDLCAKGIDLLLATTVILGVIQCVLILLKHWLFKGLIVAAGLAMWPRLTRPFGARCLALLLMLNPGLPLYLGLCEGVSGALGDPFGLEGPSSDVLKGSDRSPVRKFSDELGGATTEIRGKIRKATDEIASGSMKATVEIASVGSGRSPEAARKDEVARRDEKGSAGGWWEWSKEVLSGGLERLQRGWNSFWSGVSDRVGDLQAGVSEDLAPKIRKMGAALTALAARSVVLYVLMPLGYYILLRFAVAWAIEGFRSDLRSQGGSGGSPEVRSQPSLSVPTQT